MGDVPLGLYGINLRIHQVQPNARIHYLIREDLVDIFSMLPGCTYEVVPGMKRGDGTRLGLVVDPTKEAPWIPETVLPRLTLPEIDITRFALSGRRYIGMHIDTETGHFYGYEKNWPETHWRALIERAVALGFTPILFGTTKKNEYVGALDLRGETSLKEVCEIVASHCTALVAPDSGILSTIYYIDRSYPLTVYSLWSDPNQGVLRQGVPSPNPELIHKPLIAEDLSTIAPTFLDEIGAIVL